MKLSYRVRILKDEELVVIAAHFDSLFCINRPKLQAAKASVAAAVESVEVWHQKIAHFGEFNINLLSEMATAVNIDPSSSLGVCELCIKGRQTKIPSSEPRK